MDQEQEGQSRRNGFSRREFLGRAAKVGGGLAALPLLSLPPLAVAGAIGGAAGVAKPINIAQKVGVLLPQAGAASVAGAFLAGMNLYLAQSGQQNVKLVAANFGAGTAAVQAQAAKMLAAERPAIMVGLANPHVAAALAPQLAAARTALIAGSLGENVARRDESSPYIYYHTLGLWQANWALGNWAATNLGRTAVLGASLHDSGFDTLYAFRMGFEGAGGKVLGTTITHQSQENGLSELMSRIGAAKPAVVYGGYHGQAAAELLAAYGRAGFAGAIPLVGNSYLTEQAALNAAANGVRTAVSWSSGLETAANRAFQAAYQARTGHTADAFALLGYEAAHLAVVGLSNAASATGKADWLLDALAAATFSGPRGAVSMDGRTQATTSQLYLQQVGHSGLQLRNVIAGELHAIAEQDRQVAALRADSRTGWLNSYLYS